MSDPQQAPRPKKLDREEIMNIEVGYTAIAPWLTWTLIVLFVLASWRFGTAVLGDTQALAILKPTRWGRPHGRGAASG